MPSFGEDEPGRLATGRTNSLEDGRNVRQGKSPVVTDRHSNDRRRPLRNPNKHRLLALLIGLVLAASACGERSAAPPVPETPADKSDFPVEVEGANGTIEIESRPDKVVSLSPTATEMLFAIDAGEQVVAVDDQSNFPAEAPKTDLSGFTPNVEAIAAKEPDLVVLANDIEDVVAGLAKLDIPTLLLPAAEEIQDTYDQIETLGAATGHTDDAAELVESMKSEIEELSGRVAEPAEPQTYFHELGPELFTATSATFIGKVYDLVGLRNIADEAPDDAGGYPQLSSEFVVNADPDFIFLADSKCCGQTPETVAARPGWGDITAVKQGAVVPLDDDIASRWGPRIVDFLRAVVEATERSGAGADA
jgi:iron complex transport system substrate-binding protein